MQRMAGWQGSRIWQISKRRKPHSRRWFGNGSGCRITETRTISYYFITQISIFIHHELIPLFNMKKSLVFLIAASLITLSYQSRQAETDLERQWSSYRGYYSNGVLTRPNCQKAGILKRMKTFFGNIRCPDSDCHPRDMG